MLVPFNPFCVQGRTVDDPGPLCPWVETDHQDSYIPVDSTQIAFDEFCARLQTLNMVRDGIAVLVSGDDGCGKTSLIHRCAARLLQWQVSTTGIDGIVIDRSFENLAGMVILRKCEDTANGIFQAIAEKQGFLPPDVLKMLPDIPSGCDQIHLRKITEELSRKITRSKRHATVICPKIELAEELRTYLSIFHRPGIAVFLETDEEEVLKLAQRLNHEGKLIVLLQVGTLSVEDGWRFVEERMKRQTANAELPAFVKEGVDEYMSKRTGNAKVSVRELERVCIALYNEAGVGKVREIHYRHFADYYLRIGTLGGMYAR